MKSRDMQANMPTIVHNLAAFEMYAHITVSMAYILLGRFIIL